MERRDMRKCRVTHTVRAPYRADRANDARRLDSGPRRYATGIALVSAGGAGGAAAGGGDVCSSSRLRGCDATLDVRSVAKDSGGRDRTQMVREEGGLLLGLGLRLGLGLGSGNRSLYKTRSQVFRILHLQQVGLCPRQRGFESACNSSAWNWE